MLVRLLVRGGIGILTFRTYPQDVATADACAQRPQEKKGDAKQEESVASSGHSSAT